jgi:hypothetical protein
MPTPASSSGAVVYAVVSRWDGVCSADRGVYQTTLKTLWIDDNLQNAGKTATGKSKQIIDEIFATFKGTPYTKDGITTMCVDAMKDSFQKNTGLLRGGEFTVTAPNLGKDVPVRLVSSPDGKRINSCYPLKK